MNALRHLALALVAFIAAAGIGLAHAQALRPEIGRPLQQASQMLQAGNPRGALAEVRKAEAVAGITPAERLTIDRMKAAAAQRAGDHALAVQALNAVFPRVTGAEQAQTAESLAFAYSQLRNWSESRRWVDRARELGRDTPQLRQLVQFLQSQTGDWAAVARDAAAAVQAAERARSRPAEADLLRLADAQQRLNDSAGQMATLEKLVSYHPKQDYWAAYLGRLPRKSGFAQRLTLDVMRLKLATDTLESTEDYFEMAQLAIQAGLPAEGVKIIDKGFANGKLGTGAEAERHQRLRVLAQQRDQARRESIAADAAAAAQAPDGNALVDLGYAYVTMGEVERGIEMIEQGIAKGKLRRAEDAQLRLGMAQLQSSKHRAKGVQTLRAIRATDGVAEVARAWAVLGRA